MQLLLWIRRFHIGLYKNLIKSLIIFLVLWIISAVYFDSTFDSCATDHTLHIKDGSFRTLTRFLFYTSVAMLVLFLIQLSLWKPFNKSKGPPINFDTVFTIAFTVLWYIMTYFICVTAKVALSDANCASHPNSVSGHYAFHVYYMLALPHLYMTVAGSELSSAKQEFEAQKQRNKKDLEKKSDALRTYGFKISRRGLLLGTYVLFAVTALMTMSRTWRFGFHTLRQILYGALLGVFSHYLAIVFIALAQRSHKGPLTLMSFLTCGLMVSALVVIKHATFPLSTFEVYVSVLLWATAFVYSWWRYTSKVKQE
jgi:hypothetical protein